MLHSTSPRVGRHAQYVRLVVVLGAAAAVGTAFVVARTDVLVEPGANAALRYLNIVSAIGVGAVTWSLRPRSRLGPVLIVIGFLYAGTSLQASADPYAYNVGRLLLPRLHGRAAATPRSRSPRGASTARASGASWSRSSWRRRSRCGPPRR